MTPCVEAKLGNTDKDGYKMVPVGHAPVRAHRYVWTLFVGAIPFGMFVLHKCDNPPCINLEHLYLGTHIENCRDRSARGRQAKGEGHGNSKLTGKQVQKVLDMLEDGVKSADIARGFGVSKYLISHIKCNRAWRHIPRAAKS